MLVKVRGGLLDCRVAGREDEVVLSDDFVVSHESEDEFNEDAELPQGLPPARRNELNEAQWVHLNQLDKMIIKKLNWLKYDTLARKTLLPVGPSIEEVVDEPGSGAGETVRPAKNPHNFNSLMARGWYGDFEMRLS